METIGDARAFISAAREVALNKPIIVIKAGRTDAAAKAAASHTGSLAGSDDALDAAFKRSGVLRVNTISDLFYMAEVLGKQPRPKGNRLDHRDERWRPGRACNGCADAPRRRARADFRRNCAQAELSFCPMRGATATRSMCWAMPQPSATPKRSRSRPPTPTAMACS